MIGLRRDLRKLAWASAFVLASLPASQALAAAAPGGGSARAPARAKPAPATATCGSDVQGCQAGADAPQPETREPEGSRPPGLCGMNSADLEASLRLRCPQLYGPRFA
jgi:hypothetical protein